MTACAGASLDLPTAARPRTVVMCNTAIAHERSKMHTCLTNDAWQPGRWAMVMYACLRLHGNVKATL